MLSFNTAKQFIENPSAMLTTLKKTIKFILQDLNKAKSLPKRDKVFEYSINNVKVDGLYLEFGVFEGYTINLIALISPDKTIFGFDSFQGMPEKWDKIPKGHYKINHLPKVRKNVKLVKGMFQDSLEIFLKKHPEKIAYIHMDACLYSSTKFVLQCLAKSNRLQNGTVIQFDELFNYYGWWNDGEYKALVELSNEFDIKFRYLCYHSILRSGHISRAASIIIEKT